MCTWGASCIFAGFDDTVDVVPLTPGKIRAVSAFFAGHRSHSSGMAYISVIRCLSREVGLPVDHFNRIANV